MAGLRAGLAALSSTAGTSSVTHSASPSAVRLNAWAFISATGAGTPALIIASLFSSKLSSV